jgi:hypothetical protein
MPPEEEKELKRRRIVLCVVAGLVIFGGTVALSAQSAGGTPFLPGVAAKDPFPNGCVDCHKDQGDGKDSTVIAELAKIKVADTPTYAHPVIAGNKIFVKDQDTLAMCVIE